MAKATIGRLSAILSLNSAQFTKGMDKASKRTRKFRAGLLASAASIRRFAAVGMAAVTTGGIAMFIKRSVEGIDDIVKTADKLGIPAGKLAELQFAAERSGVSVEKFNMGMQRFIRRTGEAGKGLGEARNAFKELGLDAKELVKLRPDKAFMRLVAPLNEVETQFNRLAIAQKLFDSEGVDIINMIALQEKGIEELGREYNRLTGGISNFAGIQGVELQNAMTNIKFATEGLGIAIAETFGPTLTTALTGITKFITRTKALMDTPKQPKYAFKPGQPLGVFDQLRMIDAAGTAVLKGLGTIPVGIASILSAGPEFLLRALTFQRDLVPRGSLSSLQHAEAAFYEGKKEFDFAVQRLRSDTDMKDAMRSVGERAASIPDI